MKKCTEGGVEERTGRDGMEDKKMGGGGENMMMEIRYIGG